VTLSIRDRLLIALLPLVLIGLLGADLATTTAMQSFLSKRVDDQLVALVPSARGAMLGRDFTPGPNDRGHGGPAPDQAPAGTYAELVDPNGQQLSEQVFGSFSAAVVSRPVLPSKLPNAGPDVPTLMTVSGSGGVAQYRVAIESLDQPAGEFLVVAIPLTDIQGTVQDLFLVEAVVGALMLLLMALVIIVIVRYSLRPLERMGSTAQAIAEGDLTKRVEPASSRTEIGRLGLALNKMLGQLEHAFAEQVRSEERLRRFLADASHELRTPLTSIRGYAELLGRRGRPAEDVAVARRRIHQESLRMSALVDDLLLLARLDQGRPLEATELDLAAVVRDAGADVRAVAPDREVTVDAGAPVLVLGDDMRLRQVVGNLVRNALVHTPAGTPVEMRVRTDGAMAVLTVADHGPGIQPDEAARLFEPFYRSDPGRSRDRGGSGLGLSIVAAVVAAHGGSVRVEATPGGGATFMVELPSHVATALTAETLVPVAGAAS
jgi:two-component system, OmpR family, sensor kinase